MFSSLPFNMYFKRDFTMSNINLKLLFRMKDFLFYRYKTFPNVECAISRLRDVAKAELINLEKERLQMYTHQNKTHMK